MDWAGQKYVVGPDIPSNNAFTYEIKIISYSGYMKKISMQSTVLMQYKVWPQ